MNHDPLPSVDVCLTPAGGTMHKTQVAIEQQSVDLWMLLMLSRKGKGTRHAICPFSMTYHPIATNYHK